MARMIDADELLDDITAAEEHGGMGAVIAGTLRRYVIRQPTLTPPNEPLTCEGCACKEYSRDSYPCNSCFRNDETLSDQYRPPEGEA